MTSEQWGSKVDPSQTVMHLHQHLRLWWHKSSQWNSMKLHKHNVITLLDVRKLISCWFIIFSLSNSCLIIFYEYFLEQPYEAVIAAICTQLNIPHVWIQIKHFLTTNHGVQMWDLSSHPKFWNYFWLLKFSVLAKTKHSIKLSTHFANFLISPVVNLSKFGQFFNTFWKQLGKPFPANGLWQEFETNCFTGLSGLNKDIWLKMDIPSQTHWLVTHFVTKNGFSEDFDFAFFKSWSCIFS